MEDRQVRCKVGVAELLFHQVVKPKEPQRNLRMSAAQEAEDDPARVSQSRLPGFPQQASVGNETMRIGTLAVGQILRQALVQLQAHTLPSFAATTRNLRDQGHHAIPNAPQILVRATPVCAGSSWYVCSSQLKLR